jgi:hypothetical protein
MEAGRRKEGLGEDRPGGVPALASVKQFLTNAAAPQAPLSEQNRLTMAVRQLFGDKQQLKEEYDKEKAAHEEDLRKWEDERSILKSKFSQLAEDIANRPEKASPEQLQRIDVLNSEVSLLESEIRQMKLKVQEAHVAKKVLLDQKRQYQKSISEIQSGIGDLDQEQLHISSRRLQISALEEAIRTKSRRQQELESSVRLQTFQIEKMEADRASAKRPTLSLHHCPSVTISQELLTISDDVRDCFTEISKEFSGFQQETFLEDFPSYFTKLTNENERLMRLNTQYKHRFAKLKGAEKNNVLLTAKKVKTAIRRILAGNQRIITETKKWKDVVKRQHELIKNLKKSPSARVVLEVSLRGIVENLMICESNAKASLIPLAERTLAELRLIP